MASTTYVAGDASVQPTREAVADAGHGSEGTGITTLEQVADILGKPLPELLKRQYRGLWATLQPGVDGARPAVTLAGVAGPATAELFAAKLVGRPLHEIVTEEARLLLGGSAPEGRARRAERLERQARAAEESVSAEAATEFAAARDRDGGKSLVTCAHWHDAGNATRLCRLHGEDIRYVVERGEWLLWSTARGQWAPDAKGKIRGLARDVVDRMVRASKNYHGPGDELFRKHAVASGNRQKLLAMIDLATSEQVAGADVAVGLAELDPDPWLLGVENGVVDLRTGAFRPAARADLVTKRAGVPYVANAPCDRWRTFLAEIFSKDEEMIRWIQRAVGYTLTGVTREELFFVLHGHGSNGKSKFLRVIFTLLGAYAQDANFNSFVHDPRRSQVRNDLAKLVGARLVIASEGNKAQKLDHQVLTRATGQDPFTARFLYEEEFTYTPQFKLWFSTNHKPVVETAAKAMRRRLVLIPFRETFEGEREDEQLLDALLAELPGILHWAIEGCLAWQHEGLKRSLPAVVRRETEAYWVEQDPIAAFMQASIVYDERQFVANPALYAAYQAWCHERQVETRDPQHFASVLNEKGIPTGKRGKHRVRLGIDLCREAKAVALQWLEDTQSAREAGFATVAEYREFLAEQAEYDAEAEEAGGPGDMEAVEDSDGGGGAGASWAPTAEALDGDASETLAGAAA